MPVTKQLADEATAPTPSAHRRAMTTTQAAEQLAAQGKPVTARAVRELSGVRMADAASAAKTWNDRERDQVATPPVPDTVQTRFEALWREAYAAADAAFDQARTGWAAKVAHAETEAAGLAETVTGLEDQVDQLRTELDQTRADASRAAQAARDQIAALTDKHNDTLAVERSRADKAEGALAAVTAERDRLLIELDRLRAAGAPSSASAPKRGAKRTTEES